MERDCYGMVRVKTDPMPDFARVKWTSSAAKAVWEPRIARVSAAREVIERYRSSCIQTVRPDKLVEVSKWCSDNNKKLIILGQHNYDPSSIYAARVPADFDPDSPFEYRCVIAEKEADEFLWRKAWQENNHRVIGELLHYPDCCSTFFNDTWKEKGFVDTSWPMAMHTLNWSLSQQKEQYLELHDIPWQNNILLRWVGVRAVSHLPCKFTCRRTRSIADADMQRGVHLGYAEEMQWLQEMLSWPVEWTALHGIAEIKCPVLAVCTNTDITMQKYTVRLHGDAYPIEGATGNVFPFVPPQLRQTALKLAPADSLWLENGFSSLEAMELFHGPILRMARAVVNIERVVEFGCGNGYLLKKLGEIHTSAKMIGIEIDADKARKARLRLPYAEIITGNSLDVEVNRAPFTLAIFTPYHLGERGEEFMTKLLKIASIALIYGYADNIKREPIPDILFRFGWVRSRPIIGETNQVSEAHVFQL